MKQLKAMLGRIIGRRGRTISVELVGDEFDEVRLCVGEHFFSAGKGKAFRVETVHLDHDGTAKLALVLGKALALMEAGRKPNGHRKR